MTLFISSIDSENYFHEEKIHHQKLQNKILHDPGFVMLERMANFQTETSKKISHKFQKRTSMALEEIDVKMGENKIETGKNKKDF